MRDFYAQSQPAPLDQADGLRRLFEGRRLQLLPLAANPHVAFSGVVLDHLALALAAMGRRVLVVDAGATSPPPHELARVDLAACIETLSPGVHYLPARGLPLSYVDTRGCASGFIDALERAAPQVDVMVLHGDALDLARVLKRRSARPLLLGADHPESIKHAYASCKLLVQRCGLMTFDLLLSAASRSPRLRAISDSLAGCADQFLGAVLRYTAVIDPASDPISDPMSDSASGPTRAHLAKLDPALAELLGAQLTLDPTPLPQSAARHGAMPWPLPTAHAAHSGVIAGTTADARSHAISD